MRYRSHWSSKVCTWILVMMFSLTDIVSFSPAYAQAVLDLPAPGSMVAQSNTFVPVMLRAVKIHLDQPLVFDFIIDPGNTKASRDDIQLESEKIAKYFLASLTIPEKDLWVNLSPYENDRIIPEALGQTEMGRDLLAQDYILKQLSASLVHPDKELGKAFWHRVYLRAKAELGSTEIPASTFNKIWIVPDKAVVYENKDTAIVGESHFKVMLEQDYLAMKNNLDNTTLATDTISDDTVGKASKLSSDIVRDIVIPELEKEVNTGKNFAPLRQIQNALILATWYKENLKESLLAQVYADQRKIAGVDLADKTIKDQIYERYIAAYREGVFNLIREDQDPMTQEILPRKYFSGGLVDLVSKVAENRPIESAPAVVTQPTEKGEKFQQVTIAVGEEKRSSTKGAFERAVQVINERIGTVPAIPDELGEDISTRQALDIEGTAAREKFKTEALIPFLAATAEQLKSIPESAPQVLGVVREVLQRSSSRLNDLQGLAEPSRGLPEFQKVLQAVGIPIPGDFSQKPGEGVKLSPQEVEARLSATARQQLPENVLLNVRAGVFNSEEHVKALNYLAGVFAIQEQAIQQTKKDGTPVGQAETVPEGIILLKEALAQWSVPAAGQAETDVLTAKKQEFLRDVLFRNSVYPTGLIGYAEWGRQKNIEFALDMNPFAGTMPERVQVVNETDFRSEQYARNVQRGVEEARFNVYAIPVGGRGERLGEDDSRIVLAHNAITGKPYLQEIIEKILAAQKESNRIAREKNPQAKEILNPLVLMTSEATHERILNLLQANNYFGMEGVGFIDVTVGEKAVYSAAEGRVVVLDATGKKIRNAEQIILLRQADVPAMFGARGQFFVSKSNPYRLEAKPHNHGDIHMLMRMSGLSSAFREAQFARTVVFQDTNGEVFNAIFSAIGGMVNVEAGKTVNTKKLNIIAVQLNPGDKVGTLVQFRRPNGTGFVQNVEYNQRGQVFGDQAVQKYMAEKGLVPDRDFLSGNINVYIMDQGEYDNILQRTNGMVNEIVNPNKNKISRLEAMMQDIYVYFSEKDTVVTNYDTRFVFNAMKNGLDNGLIATAKGLFTESPASVEGEQYVSHRQVAAQSGMEFVTPEGHPVAPEGKVAYAFPGRYVVEINAKGAVRVQGPYLKEKGLTKTWTPDNEFGTPQKRMELVGIPYRSGARILWAFLTPAEAQQKISGGKVTENSVLLIHSRDVQLRNVELNGALEVQTEEGASVALEGTVVRNKGWQLWDLTPEELLSPTVSRDAKMRGYYHQKVETASLYVVKGSAVIGPNVDLQGVVIIENNAVEPFHTQALTAALLPEVVEGRRILRDKKVTVSPTGQISLTDASQKTVEQLAKPREAAIVENPNKATDVGGIDLNGTAGTLKVERTGERIKVTVDPVLIERIKTHGVDGFRPVIINIMPIDTLLPALGLNDATKEKTLSHASG